MKKRILSVLFVSMLILSLAACGKKTEPASNTASETTSISSTEAASASSSEAVSESSSGSASEASSEQISGSSSEPVSGSSSETSSASASETSSSSASETSSASSAEEHLLGGWTIAEQDAVVLPEEIQAAFDKVAVDENKDLVPVALVAQQVVSGTNDMILCKNGDEYSMIVIYRDLDGNAELRTTVPFNLADYTQGESVVNIEPLAGGWAAHEEIAAIALPEEAKAAMEKALEGFVGSNVEPLALLGTQVVSGTNYAVLCKVTPVVPDAVSKVQVVTVYADLDGNATITSFSPIDPAAFNN